MASAFIPDSFLISIPYLKYLINKVGLVCDNFYILDTVQLVLLSIVLRRFYVANVAGT